MAKNEIDFSPQNPENAAAGAPQAEAETPEEELEIAVGPEPEEKAEVVTLTPEQFKALQASGDSAKAVKEGIEGLASKLQTPVVQAPANAPQQTPEEFFAEHSDDIFDKEKGAAILAKHSKMVAEREYGPLLRGLSSTLANTRKELLESKDPHFKKYKGEVEQLVRQQTPEVQMMPDVFERAWITVRQQHSSEIEEEVVNDKVSKAVEAKLKELGIDPSKPPARPAAHVNSEGRSTPAMSMEGKPKVRLPDAATKERFEREAARKGIPMADYLRIKGYRE